MARLQTRRTSGHRVLVIDDCAEILASVARLLRFEGHEVSTAATAAEGIAQAQAFRPHLVLVDYYLDGGDLGTRVIEAIRARDEDVQIVLMTGYAGNVAPRQLLRALDIQGYHDKGDGPDQLLFCVDAALASFRSAERMRRRATALRGVIAAAEELRVAGDALHTALRHALELTRRDDGLIVSCSRGGAGEPRIAASAGRFAGTRLETLEPHARSAVKRALAGEVAVVGDVVAAPLRVGENTLGCLLATCDVEAHEALTLLARQLAWALADRRPSAGADRPDEAIEARS